MKVYRHVIIRGRVQGIGYRAWTEVTALERGVEGWVRNRRDGSVEALFSGLDDEVAIERLDELDVVESLEMLPQGPEDQGGFIFLDRERLVPLDDPRMPA